MGNMVSARHTRTIFFYRVFFLNGFVKFTGRFFRGFCKRSAPEASVIPISSGV